MELFVILLVPALALLAAIAWILWQLLRGIGFLVMKVLKGVGSIIKRVFGFVRDEAVELVQFASAGLSLCFLLPFTAGNFLTGRWARARHYATSIEEEFESALMGAYRVVLGHPLRFIGLGGVLEGVERRLPSTIKSAPKGMRSTAEAMKFEGYDVKGTLKAGGSGAQLYRARPTKETLERFKNKDKEIGEEVVIKSFALVNGSTLPQIIRESRALEAANRLGLIYEHDLDEDRFFYVMPYVDGDNLDQVIEDMHAQSGPRGLDRKQLALALGYGRDMLRSLDRFHVGGLWHKDVKPANLIISGDRAHLVDFGLVTPLQSAMTLTTHGTEYYRDPEMVRLAMQGVKVHEVDGVKFDIYSAGAVLFSMIEGSFPAHGSLSQLTKQCPEALAWIVRRSMADIGSRYRGAWEILDDLKTVAKARDPYLLRPADLPSMQRGHGEERSAEADQSANRFGLPARRAERASRLRPTNRSERLAESPPILPNAKQLKSEARRKRGKRSLRLFAALLLGMLGLGALAAMQRLREGVGGQVEGYEGDLAQARSVQDPGFTELRESPASELQKQDLRVGEEVLRELRPRSGAKGGDLESLTSGLNSIEAGSQVYILQGATDSVTPKVMSELRSSLRAQGFHVAKPGENQTQAARLRLVVGGASVGDGEVIERLKEYLGQHAELGALIWVGEGEGRGTSEYELVLASN